MFAFIILVAVCVKIVQHTSDMAACFTAGCNLSWSGAGFETTQSCNGFLVEAALLHMRPEHISSLVRSQVTPWQLSNMVW